MLLISALALGLVETTSPNIAGSGSHIGGFSVANGGANSVVGSGGSGLGSGGGIADSVIGSIPTSAHSSGTSIEHATSANGGGSGGSGGGGGGSGSTIPWDNNGTLRSAGPGDWSIEQCLLWQRPHHLYFQLGNAFFFMAFLAPHGPFGMLWLRSVMVIGCILMAMYGWLIECTPDVVLWAGLFLGVNLIYLIVLLCRLRPVRFEKEIEAVYESLFKPLRVSRHQFRKILNCMKLIRALKYQEVYAQEKVTKVDSLSLVLSGKLVVSQNQRALHIVFPHQFLDSPEWFGVSTDDYFQVSIMAMEESRVLIWHRDKLKLSIMAEPFLQSVFDHILGRDVVKKLMQVTQVSETMASNGFLPTGGYDDAEDKPMLVMKKGAEGHGLTALINRQLQEEHAPLLGRTYQKRIELVSSAAAASDSTSSKNNNVAYRDQTTSPC